MRPGSNSGRGSSADAAFVAPTRALRPRAMTAPITYLDNFAWSCPFCNRAKGGRVAQGRTRFFDPRHDRWPRHFMFPPATGYIVIAGATPVGHASAGPSGLDFNAGGLEGSLVTRHLAFRLRIAVDHHLGVLNCRAWQARQPAHEVLYLEGVRT